jgi:hypothetical protein
MMTIPLSLTAARIRGLAALTMTLLGLSALLGACSSAAPRPASATSSAAVRATCNQVSATLSDGPDPDADPVGYAEAQILPLSEIHTTDARLQAAIGQLASAYRAVFTSNGASSSARSAVAAAGQRIDSFCPGAAS